MFSSLSTKLALKKAGLLTSVPTLDISPTLQQKSSTFPLSKKPPPSESIWTTWLTPKSLSFSVQPWLIPPAPSVPVGTPPVPGDEAPVDPEGRLIVGSRQIIMVVFLRCVGCAFATQTFKHLRDIATRAPTLTCIAVSQGTPISTTKWLSLLGGPGPVHILYDPTRTLYATWGLGLATYWHMFNPSTTATTFRTTGWLGDKVATTITRPGLGGKGKSLIEKEQEDIVREKERKRRERAREALRAERKVNKDREIRTFGRKTSGQIAMKEEEAQEAETSVSNAMGNKWQIAGAWAVNGQGIVIWGGPAKSADDLMSLYDGCTALGL